MMAERPILFSGEMVNAILKGRKTQTRRVIKPQPVQDPDGSWRIEMHPRSGYNVERTMRNYLPDRCPYGEPGDCLWVREVFQVVEPWGSVDGEWIGDDIMEIDGRLGSEKPELIGGWWSVVYKADADICSWWRSPIHMPRWASRITLEIVNVRVERLQEITHEDALAEGIKETKEDHYYLAPLAGVPDFPWTQLIPAFASLWNHINKERGFGWDINPWVWVIEFKAVRNG